MTTISQKNDCCFEGCKTRASVFGLCAAHYKDSLKARASKSLTEWCDSGNIFVSDKRHNNGHIVFKSGKGRIQDICPKCGEEFERQKKGRRHLCLDCLHHRRKTRWERQNKKRYGKAKLKKFLAQRGDADPNYKAWTHKGPPDMKEWHCEYGECNDTYKVLLLEHITKYPRFCGKHMGKY